MTDSLHSIAIKRDEILEMEKEKLDINRQILELPKEKQSKQKLDHTKTLHYITSTVC